MSIRTRLLLSFVAVGLASVWATSYVAYTRARAALLDARYAQLASLREAKRRELETYFRKLGQHAVVLGQCALTGEALPRFADAFAQLAGDAGDADALRAFHARDFAPAYAAKSGTAPPDDLLPTSPAGRALQRAFVADSPHPLGEKQKLDRPARLPAAYADAHAEFHPGFRRAVEQYGFYDVFLATPAGDLVYTVFKEVDVGTNLGADPLHARSPGLRRAIQRASGAREGTVVFEDFTPYLPSYGQPAAFVATPVFREGRRAGVLAIQVPIGQVNDVMTGGGRWQDEGLGASGETYLVGADGLMRSDSRFLLEGDASFDAVASAGVVDRAALDKMKARKSSVLLLRIDTAASTASGRGERGTGVVADYRGVPVLSAWAPVDVLGDEARWSILSEIDEAEARAPVDALRGRFVRVGLLGTAGAALVGLLLARGIAQPIVALGKTARKLGGGDLAARTHARGRDEVAELGRTFDRMADDLQRTTVRRDYFQTLFDSMSNAVLVTDAHGPMRVRSTNRAAGALTGCGDGNCALADVLDAGDDTLARLRQGGRVEGAAGTLLGANGARVPALVTASPIEGAGGIVWVVQDVSERARAEQLEREQERLKHDMDVARKIQASLLPTRTPDLRGFDVAGWSQAADETGGDYFDWLELPDGRVVVTIADAAGHGIGSALLIASCRGYLRAAMWTTGEIARTLADVNRLLGDEMPEGRFVTAAVCTVTPSDDRAEILAAGHGPTFHYRAASDDVVVVWDADDAPIGYMAGGAVTRAFEFRAGDALVMITDGFFEWEDAAGEAFGVDRLAALLRAHHALPAARLIEVMYERVKAHVGATPQRDDLTAVVVRRTGESAAR